MIHDGFVIWKINAFLPISSSYINLFAYLQRSPMIWNVTWTRKGIISVISEYIHFETLTRSIELDIIQSFYVAFIATMLSVCKSCFILEIYYFWRSVCRNCEICFSFELFISKQFFIETILFFNTNKILSRHWILMIVRSTTFIITCRFAHNMLSPPYWAPSAVFPLPEMLFEA